MHQKKTVASNTVNTKPKFAKKRDVAHPISSMCCQVGETRWNWSQFWGTRWNWSQFLGTRWNWSRCCSCLALDNWCLKLARHLERLVYISILVLIFCLTLSIASLSCSSSVEVSRGCEAASGHQLIPQESFKVLHLQLACTCTWLAHPLGLHRARTWKFYSCLLLSTSIYVCVQLSLFVQLCSPAVSSRALEFNSNRRGAVSPQGKLGFADLAVVSFLCNHHTWCTILRPQVMGSCTMYINQLICPKNLHVTVGNINETIKCNVLSFLFQQTKYTMNCIV